MGEGVHFTNYYCQGSTVFVWSGDLRARASWCDFVSFFFFRGGWGNFWYITFFWKPLAPLGYNKRSLPLIAALARLLFGEAGWGAGGIWDMFRWIFSDKRCKFWNGINLVNMLLLWALRKKTLDPKRSTQNTLTRHRRRKREGVGGRAGRASVPDTFYCEGGQSPPPHFYTIINNFLLFFHGQLISIRTILENSSKQRVVCLNPNNVRT